MVDGSSASASEIFAAAIQDYKRGLIIGSTSTYGKGTVQRNIPLSGDFMSMFSNNQSNPDEMGSVKLTLQKFYRINGGATQLKGVTPDIILPDRYDYLKYREKDNFEALRWDEIKPLQYDIWSRDTAVSSIISQTKSDLKNNISFSAIQSNVNWLDSFNKKDFPLQLQKYRAEQKKLKAVYKKMDEAYKLKDTLTFINNTADLENINLSDDKKEKNKQWIKARNADIFIDETVRVLNKVIEKK
jgi:carboxyl-terminal processing protease